MVKAESIEFKLDPSKRLLNKGLGSFETKPEAVSVADLGWSLLHEDLSLPAAVLYRDKLEHNLKWMQDFITVYGARLAPHGKTTMAPQLFKMQLQGGAWGITLATAHQTLVAYTHGVRRILMANQLVGKANMAIISRLLRDPGFEYFCLVDSAEQIDQLGNYFGSQGHRLHVLLEIGVTGGRAGIRNDEQLNSTLAALSRWQEVIALDGVEVFEGVLHNETLIREWLGRVSDVAHRILAEKRFKRAPFLLTGAGSAWYDVVVEAFTSSGFGESAEVVLRPGCYLTHDVGAYKDAQQRILEHNPIAHRMKSGLLPALHVWAYVQSIPEPGKAIIAMGKRDAAFDSGLPVAALHFRPGNANPTTASPVWEITKMMDQHSFLKMVPGDDLRVGDMIGFDICHPCLTFDKWRTLAVVNAEYQVVDLIDTFF